MTKSVTRSVCGLVRVHAYTHTHREGDNKSFNANVAKVFLEGGLQIRWDERALDAARRVMT